MANKIKMTEQEVINQKKQKRDRAVIRRAAFYRENPHRFCKDYLGLNLKLFQQILIVMMNYNNFFMYLASRGQGKTFITAIFCVVRCILYPGTVICVAAGTRGQASEVIKKIIEKLIPQSENLRSEIEEYKNNNADSYVKFWNTSIIKVVTSTDNARGNRATIIIVDEFRMCKLEIINKVLRKFLTAPRHPGFLDKPEYKDDPRYIERNKEIYLSSCWYQGHWSYEKTKAYCTNLVNDKRKYFLCGLPYQLAIKEGLLDSSQVEDEMSESDFSEISFMMEMECLFYGDTDGSLYSYEDISKQRVIRHTMLPYSNSLKVKDKKYLIQPKQKDEIRILSVDVALISSRRRDNDATSIFINQVTPVTKTRYQSAIIYSDSDEGERTDTEALKVRRLYDEFECDYIALDVRGLGVGIYDAISTDIYDPETGITYPALSCCNNEEYAERCTDRNAPKVIYAILGTPNFNSDCARMLREGFKQGQIHLLISEHEVEAILKEQKWYVDLEPTEQNRIKLPYIHTSLLVNELINLEYEVANNIIRVKEKSGNRKDRYSSLSYNFWVVKQLEQKLRQNNKNISSENIEFLFRKPKIK